MSEKPETRKQTTTSAESSDAIRAVLCEDEEDLAAFAERDREQPISYEAFLAKLETDGTL